MKKLILGVVSILSLHLSAQNALNLDGNDDYVGSNFTGISGTSARTVEAWIRTTANTVPANGGKQKVIVDWGSASPLGSRFTVNLLFNGAIRVEVGGNGVSGTINITDGQWHHVAAVYDPSSSTSPVKLYVDGGLDVSGNFTGVTMNTLTGGFQIGRRVDGVNSFEGDIDEVRVWNVARTPAQLLADKDDEYCTLPAGLVAYYRLNEGSAGINNSGVTTAIEDVSGANGTLNNFSLNGSSSNWVNGASVAPNGPSFVSMTASGCNEYLGPGGVVYDSSGTYLDTLVNMHNCDSVVETVLTIQQLDVSVTTSSTTLKANKGNATYRWLDCNNGYSVVTGGIQQTFTPPDPAGSYAVQVSFAGCTDTSGCYSLDGIGLAENNSSIIKLFPNPTRGKVSIAHPSGNDVSIAIYIATGELLLRLVDLGTQTSEVDLSPYPSGIYFIQLELDGNRFTTRLILE